MYFIVRMQIFVSEKTLHWGRLDLPLLGLDSDWFGTPLAPPQTFSLALDPCDLWFISSFPVPSKTHPQAAAGEFTPELWKHDVAELFLANSSNNHYLEFNLAANGAWWASKFSSPRNPSSSQPNFDSGITTYASDSSPNHSISALKIPVDLLQEEIEFSSTTKANITFIQNSPNQRFLTAAKLTGDKPDFHQPDQFLKLQFTPLHTS